MVRRRFFSAVSIFAAILRDATKWSLLRMRAE